MSSPKSMKIVKTRKSYDAAASAAFAGVFASEASDAGAHAHTGTAGSPHTPKTITTKLASAPKAPRSITTGASRTDMQISVGGVSVKKSHPTGQDAYSTTSSPASATPKAPSVPHMPHRAGTKRASPSPSPSQSQPQSQLLGTALRPCHALTGSATPDNRYKFEFPSPHLSIRNFMKLGGVLQDYTEYKLSYKRAKQLADEAAEATGANNNNNGNNDSRSGRGDCAEPRSRIITPPPRAPTVVQARVPLFGGGSFKGVVITTAKPMQQAPQQPSHHRNHHQQQQPSSSLSSFADAMADVVDAADGPDGFVAAFLAQGSSNAGSVSGSASVSASTTPVLRSPASKSWSKGVLRRERRGGSDDDDSDDDEGSGSITITASDKRPRKLSLSSSAASVPSVSLPAPASTSSSTSSLAEALTSHFTPAPGPAPAALAARAVSSSLPPGSSVVVQVSTKNLPVGSIVADTVPFGAGPRVLPPPPEQAQQQHQHQQQATSSSSSSIGGSGVGAVGRSPHVIVTTAAGRTRAPPQSPVHVAGASAGRFTVTAGTGTGARGLVSVDGGFYSVSPINTASPARPPAAPPLSASAVFRAHSASSLLAAGAADAEARALALSVPPPPSHFTAAQQGDQASSSSTNSSAGGSGGNGAGDLQYVFVRNLDPTLADIQLMREGFTDTDIDILACTVHRSAATGEPLGSAEVVLGSLADAQLFIKRYSGKLLRGRQLRLSLFSRADVGRAGVAAIAAAAAGGATGTSARRAAVFKPADPAAAAPAAAAAAAASSLAAPAPAPAPALPPQYAPATLPASVSTSPDEAGSATALAAHAALVAAEAEQPPQPEWAHLEIASALASSQSLQSARARAGLLTARAHFTPENPDTWYLFALPALAAVKIRCGGLAAQSPFALPWAAFDGVDHARNAALLLARTPGIVRSGVHASAVIDGFDGLTSLQMKATLPLRSERATEEVPYFDAVLAATEAGSILSSRWRDDAGAEARRNEYKRRVIAEVESAMPLYKMQQMQQQQQHQPMQGYAPLPPAAHSSSARYPDRSSSSSSSGPRDGSHDGHQRGHGPQRSSRGGYASGRYGFSRPPQPVSGRDRMGFSPARDREFSGGGDGGGGSGGSRGFGPAPSDDFGRRDYDRERDRDREYDQRGRGFDRGFGGDDYDRERDRERARPRNSGERGGQTAPHGRNSYGGNDRQSPAPAGRSQQQQPLHQQQHYQHQYYEQQSHQQQQQYEQQPAHADGDRQTQMRRGDSDQAIALD